MDDDLEHRGGRPPRQFTAEERNQAEVLSGIGLPHRQIAVLIGCDEKTLRKHLGEELTRGDAKATAKIAQCLFGKAMSGDTASMIFWMNVRAGWSERVVQEHTGPGGGAPVSLNVRFVDRPPSETREQWVARRQRELDQTQRLRDVPAGTGD
jgi:hypothetical protein